MAYTSPPVCVPARQAMLTGQSLLASGILNNEGYVPAGFEAPEMFPETLAQAGWNTANYGKEHLPNNRSPWQHDDHSGSGMHELLDVARTNNAEVRRSPGMGHVYPAVLPEGSANSSEVITGSTAAALQNADGSFVIRASYVQPHKPMVVAEPWASRYAHVNFTVPRSPKFSGNEFEREWGRLTRGEELTDEEIQLSLQMYYGCVSWLDDPVGEILRALKEFGQLESTIVIFTTDRGASLGEYGLVAKHTFAPESHRVPLIISWPGTLPEGERRADLTVSEGIAATALGLVQVPAPATNKACDLFRDPAPQTVLSAIGYGESSSRAFPARDAGGWSDGAGWPQRVCIRSVRYRLDLNTRSAGRPIGEREQDLFLAVSLNDPYERVNFANNPRYREELLNQILDVSRTIPLSVPEVEDFAKSGSGSMDRHKDVNLQKGENMEPVNAGHSSGCCSPSRSATATLTAEASFLLTTRSSVSHEDVPVPDGKFLMGDAFNEGYAANGETPVHEVKMDSFRIDTTAVTNRQFAAFVEATGYRTEAEMYGSSAVFHLLLQAPTKDVLGAAAGAVWWLNVRGADWAHPAGARSFWAESADHPVVHVSHSDALAYCAWAQRRLPTEAEWEYAARGGLQGKRYAWGNELRPGGEHQCNIWQGTFPTVNHQQDGFLGTAAVKSFAPNGYGLYEVAGNVWEWCSDWFLPKYYRNSPTENPQGPTIGAGRVMRGGSYLCHDSYCNRYRVAARTSNTPESSSGNCGFRTVALR